MSIHANSLFSRGGTHKHPGLVDSIIPVVKDLTSKALAEHSASSNETVTYPDKTVWTAKEATEDVGHQIISSHFIGPQAENMAYFKHNIDIILEEHRLARVNYFPEDGV